MKLYNFLVNRHPGIRDRYHRMHDQAGGAGRILSYVYLLCLNLGYYLFRRKSLNQKTGAEVYEEKKLPLESESRLTWEEIPKIEEILSKAAKADIVSFDLFDTLLLRPFSSPTDVFWFLNDSFPVQNLREIRIGQEYQARTDCRKQKGHSEITFAEIWKRIERETGIPAQDGMKAEMNLEKRFCFANPYMKQLYDRLTAEGKRIIIVSDMYLPSAFLAELLEDRGMKGYEGIYVSCEYGCSKADGRLFAVIEKDFPAGTRFLHIGDSVHSDYKAAQKAGWEACLYPNVNRYSTKYRAEDMSPIIGSAYRGIIDSHLYNGLVREELPYEYGFIYGGLFVLGYCNYIHQYINAHQIEKVLFLSRDGEVLKQVYDELYPGGNTAYVYWSRSAATKLMAKWNRNDYFERFLHHKSNQNITIKDALESMDLDIDELGGLPEKVSEGEELKTENVSAIENWLKDHFETIIASYEEQNRAAETYYKQQLADISKAAVIDIGWAGSGAMALSCLCSREWGIPCEITGMIAGTNTIHNAEPYATERYRQTGKLVAYLYSPAFNRDLFKKHDPNLNYNVYWELLLSSVEPQFRRFEFDNDRKVVPVFGKCDSNLDGIRKIRQGIMDFVKIYSSHFEGMSEMLEVSGRDAYAPMLLAASDGERYLKKIYSSFDIEIQVI